MPVWHDIESCVTVHGKRFWNFRTYGNCSSKLDCQTFKLTVFSSQMTDSPNRFKTVSNCWNTPSQIDRLEVMISFDVLIAVSIHRFKSSFIRIIQLCWRDNRRAWLSMTDMPDMLLPDRCVSVTVDTPTHRWMDSAGLMDNADSVLRVWLIPHERYPFCEKWWEIEVRGNRSDIKKTFLECMRRSERIRVVQQNDIILKLIVLVTIGTGNIWGHSR